MSVRSKLKDLANKVLTEISCALLISLCMLHNCPSSSLNILGIHIAINYFGIFCFSVLSMHVMAAALAMHTCIGTIIAE
jgi:hypothetical protein